MIAAILILLSLLPSILYGAQAPASGLEEKSYPPGSYISPAQQIPDWVKSITMKTDVRYHNDPANCIDVALRIKGQHVSGGTGICGQPGGFKTKTGAVMEFYLFKVSQYSGFQGNVQSEIKTQNTLKTSSTIVME